MEEGKNTLHVEAEHESSFQYKEGTNEYTLTMPESEFDFVKYETKKDEPAEVNTNKDIENEIQLLDPPSEYKTQKQVCGDYLVRYAAEHSGQKPTIEQAMIDLQAEFALRYGTRGEDLQTWVTNFNNLNPTGYQLDVNSEEAMLQYEMAKKRDPPVDGKKLRLALQSNMKKNNVNLSTNMEVTARADQKLNEYAKNLPSENRKNSEGLSDLKDRQQKNGSDFMKDGTPKNPDQRMLDAHADLRNIS